jgi:hypothetical protein
MQMCHGQMLLQVWGCECPKITDLMTARIYHTQGFLCSKPNGHPAACFDLIAASDDRHTIWRNRQVQTLICAIRDMRCLHQFSTFRRAPNPLSKVSWCHADRMFAIFQQLQRLSEVSSLRRILQFRNHQQLVTPPKNVEGHALMGGICD